MEFVGNWAFHSIGTFGEDGIEYMDAQAYLSSPMPYVDETDPEAVADEMDERNKMIKSRVKVSPEGLMYFMLPIPEGVSQEEVDAVVATGELKLMDGMLYDNALPWQERDGQLWYAADADEWVNATDEEGYLSMMNIRFAKE